MTYTDLIYCDEWKSWRDPEVPETFNPTTFLLDKHIGTQNESKIGLIIDSESHTYSNLLAMTCRVSNGLKSLGLRPGERLLMFGTNSVDYIATWLGAIRAGIVPVVVSDLYKSDNLLYFINDTASEALFIDEEQVQKLQSIEDKITLDLSSVIIRGDNMQISNLCSDNFQTIRFTTLIGNKNQVFDPVLCHRNDISYMFYSGGTTGPAKGITHLTHDFIIVPERHGEFWQYNDKDIVHATSKAYFTHGLWPGILIPLYWGATSVISRNSPNAENIFKIIERERVTKLITVPTVIKNLITWAEEINEIPKMESISLVVSASEKMPPEVFEKFDYLFGLEILDSIGSSEVTYEWIANRPKDFKRGSLGKPVFGVGIKLIDDNGDEITKPNISGECWVESQTACFFYWRKYDKSRDTFIGSWTRTGDTLFFDEDGFFWFSGRSDDVFKVRGLWVSPIEVEGAITEHKSVLEAAVIPSDNKGLTVPKAFVVLQQGQKGDKNLIKELKKSVRKIGGYKIPEEVIFVDDLPRTTLMKIDRRTLRENNG